MIVMKFGGSSLATARAIQRVIKIVHAQLHRQPIVVVSALGSTTDQLTAILKAAGRGNTYDAWKLQNELKQLHFCVAEDLLENPLLENVDQYLRLQFRDLTNRVLEICEDGRSITPALTDEVLSLGEQLSSTIVAAAFNAAGIAAIHFDSRKVILTNNEFNRAVPRYWETYANLRWSLPIQAKSRVPVLGGFIGATEKQETTTLGRGGSDLTASIVGAAVNAEEIQVWKDVDGMLTQNPQIKKGGYCITELSYEEAAELARAGAKILHPDTMAPAQRLHIPIVLKNSFRSHLEGTRIVSQPIATTHPVKSIACRPNVLFLEISPIGEGIDFAGFVREFTAFCQKNRVPGEAIGVHNEKLYFLVDGHYDATNFNFEHPASVRMRTRQAVLTLVGAGLADNPSIVSRLELLLKSRDAVILPQQPGSCALKLIVPAQDLLTFVELLDREFFRNPDPKVFVPSAASEESRDTTVVSAPLLPASEAPRPLAIRPRLVFLK